MVVRTPITAIGFGHLGSLPAAAHVTRFSVRPRYCGVSKESSKHTHVLSTDLSKQPSQSRHDYLNCVQNQDLLRYDVSWKPIGLLARRAEPTVPAQTVRTRQG